MSDGASGVLSPSHYGQMDSWKVEQVDRQLAHYV